MSRLWTLAVSVLILAGLAGLSAACGGARRAPDFQQDFRGGTKAARDAWFAALATRYGCDTILVKAPGTEGLMRDATVCASARTVMPETIRAWSDSAGTWEEWEYFGSREGGGFGQTPWWGQSKRCKVTVRGASPRDLRVSDIVC